MKTWSLEDAQNEGTKISISRILQCDAETAFKAFDDQHIPKWFKEIESANWISSEREKAGAIRQVNLDIMNVQEHFMTYESGKRFTFHFKAASLPLLGAMIEDCQFRDLNDGTSEFIWDVYVEPKILSPLLSPVVKLIYNRMFGKGTDNLEQYVKTL